MHAATHDSRTARDWSQFALLLIDVQRDFWPDRMAARFLSFPADVERLLAFCRAEGLEVVHLRARFRPDMSDWMAVHKLRGRTPCVEGTAEVQTLPFAVEQPGETVILKQAFDGFQTAELEAHLRRTGKRFLLTAGLVTSVCVLLTTASAVQRGFLTAVVEDCCADRPEAHRQTLDHYSGLLFHRTTVNGLAADHVTWCAALESLDAVREASH
jgi:nicotinamidase-related amidase